MEDFVHLHVHTKYSKCEGLSEIKNLVDHAINDGMKGMAITDHGTLLGIREFSDYCNQVNKERARNGIEPFKPIVGCEMWVAHHRMQDKKVSDGDRGGYHLTVLAKNQKGYRNLSKLVSDSWKEGFYYRPRTDRQELERYHEGLIVCSGCIAGEIPYKILHSSIDDAREAVEWYHHVFGDDYYLEIQRYSTDNQDTHTDSEIYELQQRVNPLLIKLGKEYGIKVIATNNCHFVDEGSIDDQLTTIDIRGTYGLPFDRQERFKTRKEMNDVFADIPEVLRNTMEILNKVEIYKYDS